MTKQVKIQETENGQKYFVIYEVRAKKIDGDVITSDRFLNKKDAEEQVKFIYDTYKKLYTTAWIRESFIWC